MELGDAMAFVAAVDGGSFAAGGRARGLTRSAIAKALARLEARLGVRLLNRSTRELSLTDDGRLFYARYTQILAELAELEASGKGPAAQPHGVLRLSLPDAYGRVRVLPLLQAFARRWPALEVEASFSDRIVDIVEEGFDLAIRIGSAQRDANLISRLIEQQHGVLCAAPAYLAERGTPLLPPDLAQHDCLLFSSRARQQQWRVDAGDDVGWQAVSGRSRFRLDSAEALRSAAVAGMGIACLPAFLVADDLAAGRLSALLPDYATEAVPIYAIYASRRHLAPKVRALIDLLLGKAEDVSPLSTG